MKLFQGDMFVNPGSSIIVVTANSVIKKDGCLTMGKGAAKRLVQECPGIDAQFGKCVDNMDFFGYREVSYEEKKRGIFQTKMDWKLPSTISMIMTSVDVFKKHIDKNTIYRLNFPGIGCGDLAHKRDEILDLISILPDNVEIWEFPV